MACDRDTPDKEVIGKKHSKSKRILLLLALASEQPHCNAEDVELPPEKRSWAKQDRLLRVRPASLDDCCIVFGCRVSDSAAIALRKHRRTTSRWRSWPHEATCVTKLMHCSCAVLCRCLVGTVNRRKQRSSNVVNLGSAPGLSPVMFHCGHIALVGRFFHVHGHQFKLKPGVLIQHLRFWNEVPNLGRHTTRA
jgi:hypothetical protein